MQLPELLAPAGNMERLQAALRFGADAVYLGAKSMSLRNLADNFGPEELQSACKLAHAQGRKTYVTCNAFAYENELASLPELIGDIQAAGADALIVSDPGVLRVARRVAPGLSLHLSTQANTLNSEAALFWMDAGVQRVILARELSLAQVKMIRDKLPPELGLEIFVHGAMCISYSGRCLMSNYFAGRDCYKGECVQPCRWTYELRERGKNGEYYPVEQNERGTFVLNSRDLNLLAHLPAVLDTGVCSIKLEGRMKSIAYVATVTNAYRMALDALSRGELALKMPALVQELEKASHRPYTTGFAFGAPGPSGQENQSGGYVSDETIAAVAESWDAEKREALVVQRNRFFDGEELNILSPGDIGRRFTVQGIRTEEGEAVTSAPHPKQRLIIGCTEPLLPGDILRK